MSEVAIPLTVAAVEKNASEQVRVILDEFKGTRLVDMRVFATFSAASVSMPTKKGLSLRVALIPALIAALSQAHAEAQAMGWLSE
jgi:hypothetical protein